MSTKESIIGFTSARIRSILSEPSDSAARASLARLRRGIGHTPGELPELWGEFLLGMPEELMGSGTAISREEWAVYTALTLFALHQQGKDRRSEPMHAQNISLGAAANRLIKNESEDRERVARRFYAAATASDMQELAHHLRGLVTLLRAENIPMDYVRLAADLYFFQNPDTVDSIRLRWGEDFCRIRNSNKSEA
ncbi:MAG: type I-E CRISPR-associated protein Cse2/CasB [Firmicutes bacterium]|nr:type I-E CRISPR-associated protein Cse2/CasB [Bacillota bacterium]